MGEETYLQKQEKNLVFIQFIVTLNKPTGEPN
jgi:hypothetical protein